MMKKENSFVGQIDLLALLGAEIREIDSQDYIVIPLDANPTIEIKEKKNGELKAQLELFLKEIDGRFGNSHFIKANISKISLEKMAMTYIEARQFSPIIGNIKPLAHDTGVPSPTELPEHRERYHRKQYRNRGDRKSY